MKPFSTRISPRFLVPPSDPCSRVASASWSIVIRLAWTAMRPIRVFARSLAMVAPPIGRRPVRVEIRTRQVVRAFGLTCVGLAKHARGAKPTGKGAGRREGRWRGVEL